MVSHGRRRREAGEEVSREFRECRSLERSLWGTPCLSPNVYPRPAFELKQLVYVQEDRLWIADPKALNHILQKSGYLYGKPDSIQEQSALLTGHGIGSAEGGLSVTIGRFLFPTCLTATQVRYTNGRGGRWPRRLASSRLKACYRTSWILSPRHVAIIHISS